MEICTFISEWARKEVDLALRNGIVKGTSNKFAPQTHATRAKQQLC
ncbi:S-layer homology domain-containing protein [Paenibacillus sp. UMB4589-SE434]